MMAATARLVNQVPDNPLANSIPLVISKVPAKNPKKESTKIGVEKITAGEITWTIVLKRVTTTIVPMIQVKLPARKLMNKDFLV